MKSYAPSVEPLSSCVRPAQIVGKPPRECFVLQFEEAKTEWRGRKGKSDMQWTCGMLLATSESTSILGQTFQVSHAPAIRELNLPTICWVRWLKTTYSPGEHACSSCILASAVCKSRTASTHSKFTTSIFFRMSKRCSMAAPLCNKSGKLSSARLDLANGDFLWLSGARHRHEM
jgi:hypothetical protein